MIINESIRKKRHKLPKKLPPKAKAITKEINKLKEEINYSNEHNRPINKFCSLLVLLIYFILANLYISNIRINSFQDITFDDLIGFLIIWYGIICGLLCILGAYGTILIWIKVRFTIFFLLLLKILLSIILLLYGILIAHGQIIIYEIKLNIQILCLFFGEFIVFTTASITTIRRYNKLTSTEISKYKLYQFVLERQTIKGLSKRQCYIANLGRVISSFFCSIQIFMACLGIVGIIKFGEGFSIREETGYYTFLSWRVLTGIIILMANFEITISVIRGCSYLSTIHLFSILNICISILLLYQMKMTKPQKSFFRWDSTDTSQSFPIIIDFIVNIIAQYSLLLSIHPIKHR